MPREGMLTPSETRGLPAWAGAEITRAHAKAVVRAKAGTPASRRLTTEIHDIIGYSPGPAIADKWLARILGRADQQSPTSGNPDRRIKRNISNVINVNKLPAIHLSFISLAFRSTISRRRHSSNPLASIKKRVRGLIFFARIQFDSE